MISDPVHPARTESVSLSSVATTILAELNLMENRISDEVIAMIRTRIQDSTKLFASDQFPEPDDDESDLEDDESDLDDDESDS